MAEDLHSLTRPEVELALRTGLRPAAIKLEIDVSNPRITSSTEKRDIHARVRPCNARMGMRFAILALQFLRGDFHACVLGSRTARMGLTILPDNPLMRADCIPKVRGASHLALLTRPIAGSWGHGGHRVTSEQRGHVGDMGGRHENLEGGHDGVSLWCAGS